MEILQLSTASHTVTFFEEGGGCGVVWGGEFNIFCGSKSFFFFFSSGNVYRSEIGFEWRCGASFPFLWFACTGRYDVGWGGGGWGHRSGAGNHTVDVEKVQTAHHHNSDRGKKRESEGTAVAFGPDRDFPVQKTLSPQQQRTYDKSVLLQRNGFGGWWGKGQRGKEESWRIANEGGGFLGGKGRGEQAMFGARARLFVPFPGKVSGRVALFAAQSHDFSSKRMVSQRMDRACITSFFSFFSLLFCFFFFSSSSSVSLPPHLVS